jgi:hypothetical protein
MEISDQMQARADAQVLGATIAWGGDGKFYDFDNPNPWVIELEDVAYALAYTVRWRGQTRYPLAGTNGRARCFFGVGQHCVHGAEEMLRAGHGPAHALAFLWHEPDEIPLPDFPGPAKGCVPGLRPFAKRHGAAILDRFGITIPDPDFIKVWDLRMLNTEKRDLLPGYEAYEFQDSDLEPCGESLFPPFERRIYPYAHPDQAAVRWLAVERQLRAVL